MLSLKKKNKINPEALQIGGNKKQDRMELNI